MESFKCREREIEPHTQKKGKREIVCAESFKVKQYN